MAIVSKQDLKEGEEDSNGDNVKFDKPTTVKKKGKHLQSSEL